MDKFIVSARKYRPQNFSTVVGQAHITTTLKNAIRNNQLAHAFLFCGPRGVGKTTCARILAKTINCENLQKDGEACNQCQSCVSFNDGASMNIHELDAASNNSVDDIRTLVEQVRFAPQAGKYKVYIIDEVHMLSSSAFNAFLKTLEEPPPYAIFILATTEKHKILPTILSRCQIFDFKRITTNDTVEHLQEICDKEAIKAEREALHVISQKSEGCMRDALSILDKIVSFTNGELTYRNTLEHLNILDAEYYFKLTDMLYQQDLAGSMLMYDEINRKGFEGDLFINGYAEFIRNLLVSTDKKVAALLDVVESFRDKYASTAKKLSLSYMISALNILNEAEINYKAARNKRLHVELMLIKLCYLQQAITIAGDASGKKKLNEAGKLNFRQIPFIELKPKNKKAAPPPSNTSATLMIEVPTEQPVATVAVEKKAPRAATTTQAPSNGDNRKISGLKSIRQQIMGQQSDSNSFVNEPITKEALQKAWHKFIQKLKAENKISAANILELSEIKFSDNYITLMTYNIIQQKFAESEKVSLNEFLQSELNNRQFTLVIVKIENQDDKEPTERILSSREVYQLIIQKYPMIKELKDRLGLELDY
jgi:DNA polymerase-3 subunit gamma/tau